MSNAPIPSFSSLPVEILYRICNNLDAPTILFSLRSTCRRLKAIVDNYDKYNLDFQSVSKSNFQLLCRLVNPQQVVSLTLSPIDETLDQNKLFLSFFRARQFSRIRSLTLIGIEESQLKVILKRFHIPSLTSFSFVLDKYDDRRKNTTAKFLSSIIAQAKLYYLNLEIRSNRVEKLTWPVQCAIRYLKINIGAEPDLIFTILRCSPHLQTLVISFSNYNLQKIVLSNSLPPSFQQLTSLSLENLNTTIDNLEMLLSLMTSLTHFKLTGYGPYMDGNRWEQFIQANLPSLNKFELFVHERKHVDSTHEDVESIIASFQTSFWLEHKKWFFTCEYTLIYPRLIKLCSIPICVSSLTYEPDSLKFSLSTFNSIINNDTSIMNNVNTIQLIFSKFRLNDIQQKLQTSASPIFPNVTKLELDCNAAREPNWTSFVSTLINLTTITQIKLTGTMICQADPGIITDLSNLLRQTYNLTTLDICCQYHYRRSQLTAQDICSMTPLHVKHLAASIADLNEVKTSLEQLHNLITARFFYKRTSFSNSVTEWLDEKKRGSSYVIGSIYTKLWLTQNNTQVTMIRNGNKRMKLTAE